MPSVYLSQLSLTLRRAVCEQRDQQRHVVNVVEVGAHLVDSTRKFGLERNNTGTSSMWLLLQNVLYIHIYKHAYKNNIRTVSLSFNLQHLNRKTLTRTSHWDTCLLFDYRVDLINPIPHREKPQIDFLERFTGPGNPAGLHQPLLFRGNPKISTDSGIPLCCRILNPLSSYTSRALVDQINPCFFWVFLV